MYILDKWRITLFHRNLSIRYVVLWCVCFLRLLTIVLGFTYTFVLAKGVSSYNNALIMRLVIMVVSLSQ
jgi:hypothetical protein